MYFWLGPLLIVFNFDAKSSCYLCICVAHLVARVAIAAARVAAACLEQFRSTASVRLDDFMENFIEQAETISFGAINVVRCTLGQQRGIAVCRAATDKWVRVLFECF